MRGEWQRSLAIRVIILVALGALALWLSMGRQLERLDLVLYDTLLPLQGQYDMGPVVIVAIDDASLAELGRWPWSRRRHAALMDRLTEAGARAVGFDILVSEAQHDEPVADRLLAGALRRNGRTVLAVAPSQEFPGAPITELLPIPELAIAAAALGHVDVELDLDGLCRRTYLYGGIGDGRWSVLALAMLQVAGEPPLLASAPRLQEASPEGTGWVRRGEAMIPYASPDFAPREVSYHEVLSGKVPSSALAGKYVLVGATATGLGDAISTPASRSHERMPGVELNAHVLNGLIRDAVIHEAKPVTKALLSVIVVAAVVLLLVLWPLRAGLVLALAAMVLTIAGTAVALVAWRTWFPPVSLLLPLAVAWPLWAAWQVGVENRLTRSLMRRLEHQTRHHVITGLPNQGRLEERLGRLIDPAQSSPGVMGLMVMHINWPGSASSILGRPISDAVLRLVAERLSAAVPPDHFVAHLSGDDFAVLMPGLVDAKTVRARAEQLLDMLHRPLDGGDESLLLAPRTGVSIWPVDGRDAVTLLRNAYTAMFKSRIDGTEPLCVYSADIGQEVEARSQLEQALVHALERDEFEIHYQPQVLAESGRLVGVEALLRWHNPQLGWVGPAAFVPVAEHSGLINLIGDWVMETACRQQQAWRDTGLPSLRMSVNLSPLQFAGHALVERVGELMQRYDVAPADLELEVTESTLMRDLESAVRAMKRLKTLGVGLAIDDFGTGYSSLSSLRHFPLDRIKIDQSFTREIGRSDDATEITLAILAMGRRLGLDVIAEGVETSEQGEFLQAQGCDELQGYYYSRPVPAEQIETMLRESPDGVQRGQPV